MNHTALLTLSALLLTACAAIEPAAPAPAAPLPPAPAIAAEADDDTIPYPTLDTQSQIDNLGMQVARLEYQLNSLQTRIRQLERQSAPSAAAPVRRAAALPEPSAATAAPAYPAAPPTDNARYTQALQQYRLGNYVASAELLKNAESGGNGSETARKSMYLLLQNHRQLANCESAINIGRRYANRFRSSATAPEALFAVGECQYRMQQRDIARDTWRKLMQTYPDSPAATRARRALNLR
ncbi:tetratricopeptide repeat protein [Uruburuella testudinis]|uniref:Tetratricopeptide repeat protein n=1 Tax=Uruburuella testudinis TaxID=1282863 RepID=A0ABY4DPT5_9NEIS|nr:tetratricopeptide repeat protein [Uruburuella testudinis]UOO81063.1 tetratricopeptide repeat protein [Uruburuella testudinis]